VIADVDRIAGGMAAVVNLDSPDGRSDFSRFARLEQWRVPALV